MVKCFPLHLSKLTSMLHRIQKRQFRLKLISYNFKRFNKRSIQEDFRRLVEDRMILDQKRVNIILRKLLKLNKNRDTIQNLNHKFQSASENHNKHASNIFLQQQSSWKMLLVKIIRILLFLLGIFLIALQIFLEIQEDEQLNSYEFRVPFTQEQTTLYELRKQKHFLSWKMERYENMGSIQRILVSKIKVSYSFLLGILFILISIFIQIPITFTNQNRISKNNPQLFEGINNKENILFQAATTNKDKNHSQSQLLLNQNSSVCEKDPHNLAPQPKKDSSLQRKQSTLCSINLNNENQMKCKIVATMPSQNQYLIAPKVQPSESNKENIATESQIQYGNAKESKRQGRFHHSNGNIDLSTCYQDLSLQDEETLRRLKKQEEMKKIKLNLAEDELREQLKKIIINKSKSRNFNSQSSLSSSINNHAVYINQNLNQCQSYTDQLSNASVSSRTRSNTKRLPLPTSSNNSDALKFCAKIF